MSLVNFPVHGSQSSMELYDPWISGPFRVPDSTFVLFAKISVGSAPLQKCVGDFCCSTKFGGFCRK